MLSSEDRERPIFDDKVLLASELLGARLREEPKKEKRHYTMTPENNKRLAGQKRWHKGQSGNPKGRPLKSSSIVSLVKEHLENHPEDGHSIALALISLAKRKDMRAIEELLNRVDGKVAETHKIDMLPIKLMFVPASQIIESKKPEIIEGEVKELSEGVL